MAINSKQKGKAGELELVHYLRERGIDAERTQQYCGNNGTADVKGLKGHHIECKRVEQLNVLKAYEQADNDSRNTGLIPIVCHRRNGQKRQNKIFWLATLDLDDYVNLYKELEKYRQNAK